MVSEAAGGRKLDSTQKQEGKGPIQKPLPCQQSGSELVEYETYKNITQQIKQVDVK